MGAGQVAGAHQKFVDDFAADKLEGFFKDFQPAVQIGCGGGVGVEPVFEGAVFGLDGEDLAGVVDGGVDFQAVADDAGIGKQALAVLVVKCGDGGDVKAAIGSLKGVLLAQNQRPAQAGLVDFQHQPLEKFLVVGHGKAVNVVVVVFVGVAAAGGQAVGKTAVAHAPLPFFRLPSSESR